MIQKLLVVAALGLAIAALILVLFVDPAKLKEAVVCLGFGLGAISVAALL